MTRSRKDRGGMKLTSTSTPAAKNVRVVNVPPTIKQEKGKTIIVGHEQIKTVYGSAAFESNQYAVNPGLPMYAWLSTQAAGWEKHKYRKLQYVYVPSEAVTTTPGSVYLAADYDPSDPAPETLAAMSTFETQSASRVYESLKLNMNISRMYDGVQAKKNRCGPVSGDLQLYDGATINVCTVGCADNTAIGQLWVYYEIELISVQVSPPYHLSKRVSKFNKTIAETVAGSGGTLEVQWDSEITNGLDLDFDAVEPRIVLPCGVFEVSGKLSLYSSGAAFIKFHIDLFKSTGEQSSENHYTAQDAYANAYQDREFSFFITIDNPDTSVYLYVTNDTTSSIDVKNGYFQIKVV